MWLVTLKESTLESTCCGVTLLLVGFYSLVFWLLVFEDLPLNFILRF